MAYVPPCPPTLYRLCRSCLQAFKPPLVYRTHFRLGANGVATWPNFRRNGCPKCAARGGFVHELRKRKYPIRVVLRYDRLLVRPKSHRREPLRVTLLKKLTYRAWMEWKQRLERALV